MSFFDKHDPDCSPRKVCKRCEFYEFLQGNISDAAVRNQFINFIDFYTTADRDEERSTQADNTISMRDSIKTLGLSTRTENTLRNNSITMVSDLLTLSEREVLRLDGFGKKSLKEVLRVLDSFNLHLGTSVEESQLPP